MSPFSIDTLPEERAGRLTRAFSVLEQLAPTLLESQGQGRVRGFAPVVSYEGKVDDSPQTIRLGDFQFEVSFVDPWIPRALGSRSTPERRRITPGPPPAHPARRFRHPALEAVPLSLNGRCRCALACSLQRSFAAVAGRSKLVATVRSSRCRTTFPAPA